MIVDRTLPHTLQASHAHIQHYVPGRLRLKIASLQWNEARAFSAERALRSLGGIHNATANTLTGSVLVHFDPRAISVESILEALKADGFVAAVNASLPRTTRRVNKNTLATRCADVVVKKAFETIVERGSIALIAALI
jgi:hypothetical protein